MTNVLEKNQQQWNICWLAYRDRHKYILLGKQAGYIKIAISASGTVESIIYIRFWRNSYTETNYRLSNQTLKIQEIFFILCLTKQFVKAQSKYGTSLIYFCLKLPGLPKAKLKKGVFTDIDIRKDFKYRIWMVQWTTFSIIPNNFYIVR